MPRVTSSVPRKARHKKVLKRAKGFKGARSRCYRVAKEFTDRALSYAYRDRRTKKRVFRALWIQRINAGARQFDLSYSKLTHGLKLAKIEINRKVLSELAINEPDAFKAVVEKAKAALAAA